MKKAELIKRFFTNEEIIAIDNRNRELEEENKKLQEKVNTYSEEYGKLREENKNLKEKVKELEEWLDRKEEINKKLRSDLLMYQHQYWCLTD